ncbi:MAG: response regulator [Leptolyngbyaceae cyanobacterium MO_188.B28]|nr:response regulator [Leptolyngbyaceae cyanobacterium MO_188.B28]
MDPNPVRILLVDDDEDDYILTRDLLSSSERLKFELDWVDGYDAALEHLERCQHDVYLFDYRLAGRTGLELLEATIAIGCKAPIILLTGQGDYEIDVKAMQAGAADYLEKGQLGAPLLERAIRHALERQRAEVELQRQHQRSHLFAEITLKIRQSLQLEEILQTAVTEVQKFLQADRVLMFKLHFDGSGTVVQEAVVSGWPSILGLEVVDPCFQASYLEQYRQGRIGVISDLETENIAPCYVEFLNQFGVRADLAVPILQKSELWGLLIAHQCSSPRQWSSLEIEILRQLADQIGVALAQGQLVEAMRESEKQLRMMANSAPVLLWMSGPDKQYNFFNQTWLTFTGRSIEQEIGDGWTAGVHPDDLQTCLETYATAFDTRQTFEMEYRLRRADGEYRWLLDRGAPRFMPDGGFVGYIGTCIDISERREIETLKDEFVSVVSHELRTPLTSISGALDLLASSALETRPEKTRRMLKIAANNADRLVRLVNDILDIERIESGKVKMTKQVCNVADLMAQSAEAMQNIAKTADVTLSVHPLPAQVWADPDRIIQVLTNLLSNAIKFSSVGGTVWLTAELGIGELGDRRQKTEDRRQKTKDKRQKTKDKRQKTEDRRQKTGDRRQSIQNPLSSVTFQVRDQGRGVPPDKLETIFGRFQQVDASDSRKKGGTGLGLAICRSIVQHHEGKIWAASTLGQGSVFCFTLPVLPIEEEAPAVEAIGPLVLVCDDDPSVRTVVQEMLARQHYRALTAASGQDAVNQAIAHNPHVILLNLMMPGMSGWETLAVLKEHPETKNIPVIILSGLMPDDRESPPTGISDWIVKPPDERLFQVLERVLLRRRQEAKVLIVENDLDLAQVLMSLFERHGIETYHAQKGREAIQLSQRILPDLLVLDLNIPDGDGFAVVDWLRQHNRLCRTPLVVYTAKDLNNSDRERLRLGQTLFLTKSRITCEEFEQQVINLLSRVIQDRQ